MAMLDTTGVGFGFTLMRVAAAAPTALVAKRAATVENVAADLMNLMTSPSGVDGLRIHLPVASDRQEATQGLVACTPMGDQRAARSGRSDGVQAKAAPRVGIGRGAYPYRFAAASVRQTLSLGRVG